MAAQPANTAIKVHLQVRSYVHLNLQRSVFETNSAQGAAKYIMIPGKEVLWAATRDTATDVIDTTLTAGRAYSGSNGLPIVRYVKTQPTLAQGTTVSGLNMPVRIGKDIFLEKATASVADDFYAELRAL